MSFPLPSDVTTVESWLDAGDGRRSFELQGCSRTGYTVLLCGPFGPRGGLRNQAFRASSAAVALSMAADFITQGLEVQP